MDDPCYEYRAFWSDDDGAWVGLCDGFLLVSHLAPTEPEALGGVRSLVTDIVSDMRANGEPLPRPVPWESRDAVLSGTAVVPRATGASVPD